MYPCLGNWVAIGRGAVYYARAADVFNAGITRRHCMSLDIRTFPLIDHCDTRVVPIRRPCQTRGSHVLGL